MHKNVYIGIGSNLGDRLKNITDAIDLLLKDKKVGFLKISNFYETEPKEYTKQPWFINCVIMIKTNIIPADLLLELKDIEKKLKRKKNIKYGPRTIDLDILFYGSEIINTDDLIIPHLKMQERKFVLKPLSEVAERKMHPIFKKTVSKLLKETDDKSIIRMIT